MAVKIPQYTIETHSKKRYKITPLIVIFLLILAFIAGYFSSSFYIKKSLSSVQERNDFLDSKNLEYENTLSTQLAEISILTTDKKVKTEAMLQLQNQYQQLLKTIDELNADISFYEQLLNPNADNKGLRVFRAHVKSVTPSSMILTVSLAQKIERASTISGNLELQIEGTENQKKATFKINLEQQNKYKFKYFQTLSYEFSLPEGFKPEQLVVELQPSTKNTKKIQHSISWDELIKEAG